MKYYGTDSFNNAVVMIMKCQILPLNFLYLRVVSHFPLTQKANKSVASLGSIGICLMSNQLMSKATGEAEIVFECIAFFFCTKHI